jgi:MSHA biogenesis protein MshL
VQLCAIPRDSATSCSKLLRNKDFFLMHGRSWWRLAGAVMLAAFAIRLYAQTPVPGPPDLFVTKLQGATTGTTTSPQGVPQGPAGLPPLPVTELDDRLRTADLDGPRRISLTISRPMPLPNLLLLLVNGTPLSLVNDEAVDGTFVGDLKDLTMRQALEAVLFPRGLDYDVQGTLIRVFPHRASTRLFDVNYLNVRRTWQRGIRSAVSVDGRQVSAADLTASSDNDLFDELGKGVQALLSASGRAHVDRAAGLVQVTDFSDRLDQVGVYVEAVQLRVMRQVRIEAHVFDVAFGEGSAVAVDWKAVALRTGAGTRSSAGHGAAGLTITDIDVLKKAIAEQGVITMIAAPQVVAMNNEPAVMRVGTETVYFESASTIQDSARQRTTKPGAVLEGLTLTVTVQISADGLLLLNVSPTYASRAGQSKSVDGETFPVLRINEADMMVRVRDGETIVLSGFLENRETTKATTGLAAMFGTHPRTTVKSELVILLTPSIVGPGVPVTAAVKQ